MSLKRKILTTTIGVFALTSCASLNTNDTKSLSYSKFSNNTTLENVDTNSFNLDNLKYLYKGETLNLNLDLGNEVYLTKVYSKGDNKLYGLLFDNKSNENREVLLKDIPVKSLADTLSSKSVYPYESLKYLEDDGRITYSISSLDTAFDELHSNVDPVGVKSLSLTLDVNGETKKILDNKQVKFGYSLYDFKKDYSKLLSNKLDDIKLDSEGNVTGGFDKYLTDIVTRFHESDQNLKEVKFVTEIVDGDKEAVGVHKIVRKILLGDEVVYSKEDNAYVNFPGATIVVIDGSFIDLDEELEKITYRVTPKENDKATDFLGDATSESTRRDALQGLKREHGTAVIYSMVDQVKNGTGLYAYGVIFKELLSKGKEADYSAYASSPQEYSSLIKALTYKIILANSSNANLFNVLLSIYSSIDEVDKIYNENNENYNTLTEEEKKAKEKEIYAKALETVTPLFTKNIDEKHKGVTEINFATISARKGKDGIDSNEGTKYLSEYLDRNPGAKVVNMSYGGDLSIEEYQDLTNMSDADKQKAVDEYNSNPEYRAIILSWLHKIQNRLAEEAYEETGEEYQDLSLYEYFDSRKTITKDDFDMLISAKLKSYRNYLSAAPELKLANKDVLLVRAHGNGYTQTEPDLTTFDENGKKVLVVDTDHKYNSTFSTTPSLLNYIDQENAKKNGTDYKYSYNYRKNILSVVGAANRLTGFGLLATDKNLDEWALFTFALNLYKDKDYSSGLKDEMKEITRLLEEYAINPDKTQYTKEYIEELNERLKSVNARAAEHDREYSLRDNPNKFSFTRAGKSKLWAVAAEGMISNTKALTEEEKKYNSPEEPDKNIGDILEVGSSFAAPRVAAVAGLIQNKFPWLSANGIKQLILTTANDGYTSETAVTRNLGNNILVPFYGPDEILGWGMMDDNKALKGPSRFVKALTRETGEENFIADVPYGEYTFGNHILGGFDPALSAAVYNEYNSVRAFAYSVTKNLTDEEILSGSYDDATSKLGYEVKRISGLSINAKEKLEEANITPETIVNEIRPEVRAYLETLPVEEREVFEDAGLEKRGKGTLILSGTTTYNAPTIIKEGRLVLNDVGQRLYGNVSIEEKGRLHLTGISTLLFRDLNNKGIFYNEGSDNTVDKYIPNKNAKTVLGAAGSLNINNLDLSNVDKFDFEVYKKSGDTVFGEDQDKKDILSVKNISNLDLQKVNLGKEKVSKLVDMELVKEGTGFKASLVKSALYGEESPLLNNAEVFDKLAFASASEVYSLNGNALASSMLVGFDAAELRLRNIKDTLNLNDKDNSIYAGTINEFKFRGKNSSNHFNNLDGLFVGGHLSSKYTKTGLSLDFVTSKAYSLKAFKDEYSENPVYVDANVRANVFGLSVYNKAEYKGFYLDTVLSSQYIDKYVTRDIVEEKAKETHSNDFSIDFNNEFGYKYTHKFNDDLSLNVRPYVGLDLLSYSRGEFKEDSELGYKGKREGYVKSFVNLGSEIGLNYNNFSIGVFADYSKYLTSTDLKLKASIEKYEFDTEVKGISLEDHVVNAGFKLGYKINNFSLGLNYRNKNLKNNVLNLILNYSF